VRTHNEAARMMGARARAAVGGEPGERVLASPADSVRRMLADLVPFEELDSVMQGIAASSDALAEIAQRCIDDTVAAAVLEAGGETELTHEQLLRDFGDRFSASAFIGVGQEITYALLLAKARPELDS
jgi:hypothetical protein